MVGPISLSGLLAVSLSALPLISAAGCPYIRGNEVQENTPRSLLQERFSPDGPNFGRCPRKSKVAGGGTRSWDWWPCELSLHVLRQNSPSTNPLDADFDYATEFAKLDVEELRKDLTELQTNSQVWWPADFGNYGPFFIRLAWHNAGTYRQIDGRGGSGMGQQRFAPLNSWPDNENLDKARRLLWPIKQKYGSKLSWGDLFTFAGNTAMENMGFTTYGFGFGRVDTWQADESIYWGSEQQMFPGNLSNTDRYNGSTNIIARADMLEAPLADSNMGLIYVDPRGPNGTPDPKASALDIRETFGRMGMDDEETVALIAGGHAFGKTHGAVPGSFVGPEPNAVGLEEQGLGWKNSFKTGNADWTSTSGLEVIWSTTPTEWANHYLTSLIKNNFSLVTSPGGAPQWEALDGPDTYPDPFDPNKFRRPTMLTSDLGLIHDPIYKNISHFYFNNFDTFAQDFALAWFKLLHRDMGPLSRYLGPDVPKKAPLIWQDPLPVVTYQTIDDSDISSLKSEILAAPGLNISNLVTTSWGAASSFRISDKRGGGNGGRIALKPQASFASNNPARLQVVLKALGQIKNKFNSANKAKQVSLADLIILGGTAAVEKAASDAGMKINVSFTPGRVDTTQDLTDVSTFALLEPVADGFRNFGHGNPRALSEDILVDKSNLLTLSPPEMTVLVGGMRALDANFDGSNLGIFTDRPGQLTNDFFVNLVNMSTIWTPIPNTKNELFSGKDLFTGKPKFTGTRVDLIFGSHPELRAISEVYGSSDAQSKFVNDFATAWSKVMDLDRYDIKGRPQNNVQ